MTTNAVESNQTQLPRAVRAQMARVNALLETKRPDDAPPASGAPSSTTTPPAEGGAPTPQPPAAPPTAPSADPRETDPTYWRQRFKVTEGMLRQAHERHAAEIERRDEELQQLRAKVRELEANREPQQKADLTAFFTPEQIDRFGEDQCQAMATAALKAASQQAEQLFEAQVKPIQERSQAEAQKRHEAKTAAFWERLTELYPAWETTNAKPEWLTWLQGEDPATGMVLDSILQTHFRALDADKVALMFQRFEKANAKPTPPVQPAGAGGGGSGTPPANDPAAAKGYPSAAEIKDFYKRSALRKVSDKERVEFEARLRLKAAA